MTLSYPVIELPSLHILHDDADAVLAFVDFVEGDDVGMVQSRDDLYFVLGSSHVDIVASSWYHSNLTMILIATICRVSLCMALRTMEVVPPEIGPVSYFRRATPGCSSRGAAPAP